MHAVVTSTASDNRSDAGSDQARAHLSAAEFARALGWLSVGLGLAGLMMPSALERSVGIAKRERWLRASVVHLKKSLNVNRSPEACYQFWRDFGNFPRFMLHVERVDAVDATHSRWQVRVSLSETIEWHAELISDVPAQQLGWRTTSGANMAHTAVLRFSPLPGRRGTRVEAEFDCHLPMGTASVMPAHWNSDEFSQSLSDDLRRFKQLVETGEIPTTIGQPRGQRSAAALSFTKDARHEG
jgi:uncharacterized membrane protein